MYSATRESALRLRFLIEQLTNMDTRFISIRLRGDFAHEARFLLEEVFANRGYYSYLIRIGDTYKS